VSISILDINQLTPGSTPTGSEQVPAWQSGTVSLTLDQIVALVTLSGLGGTTLAAALAAVNQTYIGTQLYPRTSAEITASVTPTNDYYPPGVIDRYGTNTTPGTTDMTSAIKAAVAQMAVSGGSPVQFLAETYLITSTPMTFTNAMNGLVSVHGVPFKSIIINQAAANNPTILLEGCEYFLIEGLVLVGKATYSNNGIRTQLDGSSNACGAGVFRDIYMTTNGGGARLQSTYEVTFDQCYYWPTGNPAPSFGGTIDTNGQPYGIWGDSSDGGQVNAIIIRDFRTSGLNTITNDSTAASIKIDGSHSGSTPMVGWRIDGLIMERSGCRSLWCRQASALVATNLWTEGTEIRIDNDSRRCTFRSIEGGNTATVVVDGTQSLGGNGYLIFEDCAGYSFTADAANFNIIEIGSLWGSGGYTNNAITSYRIGVIDSAQAAAISDSLGVAGGIALGESSTAESLTNGSTIDSGETLAVARVTTSGAVTGIIMAVGNYPGQTKVVINESGNSITMAASGTSHVADGVSCVIGALLKKTFVWDTSTSLWYHE
jgi:hypothetical protein